MSYILQFCVFLSPLVIMWAFLKRASIWRGVLWFLAKPVKCLSFMFTVLVGRSYACKVAGKRSYVLHLPLGGLFRRASIQPFTRWHIKRRWLGFRGYYLQDGQGNRLALDLQCVHADCSGRVYGTYPDRTVLDHSSLPMMYQALQGRCHKAEVELRLKSEAQQVASQSHQLAAVQVARAIALVKAAPKNGKLGRARHDLAEVLEVLVEDENRRKSLLYDAQEELEKEAARDCN